MAAHISILDQVKEAQRELALRRKVYPKMVQRQLVTEGQAAARIATMEAIVKTLQLIQFAQTGRVPVGCG
jgi:hypothetical protein